jgi:hypothetical protein
VTAYQRRMVLLGLSASAVGVLFQRGRISRRTALWLTLAGMALVVLLTAAELLGGAA